MVDVAPERLHVQQAVPPLPLNDLPWALNRPDRTSAWHHPPHANGALAVRGRVLANGSSVTQQARMWVRAITLATF
jgi:hypothetical protein